MYFQALIVYYGRPPFSSGALTWPRLREMLASRLSKSNSAKIIAVTITPADAPADELAETEKPSAGDQR